MQEPDREPQRLALLRHYQILDTEPEQEYDDLVALASAICGVPVALITLVDRDRQWFKARHGVDLSETPRDISFCTHAIQGEGIMVVPDALHDGRFAENPLVTGAPHVRFYAGVPLEVHGVALGTLCVVDIVPRELTAAQRDGLAALARQARALLEAHRVRRELAEHALALVQQRDDMAEVERRKRELTQLLVHDLRGPLATLFPCCELLIHELPRDSETLEVAHEIFTATQAMDRMLLDLLDTSASEDGRLVAVPEDLPIGPLFERVETAFAYRCVAEHRDLALSAPAGGAVRADRNLLHRVLANLVDNALKYATGHAPITLSSTLEPGHVVIRVGDDGPGIPEGQRERVFDKHVRLARDAEAHARGSRGLGLAFCRLAVEAHGGEIWVEDRDPGGSVFCLRLPRAHLA